MASQTPSDAPLCTAPDIPHHTPHPTPPHTPHNRPALANARAWAGLAVLALPTFLLGLDVTLLYLALPAIAADLQPSSTQALWIMDIYGFLIAGFLITMGTLGDRIGRRRLLMLGAAAFSAASVLAAFAPSASTLIAARAALGLAGATLMPSTLALISNLFPDARQRGLAIGVWATMFALGMAAGPVVGGVLLSWFWWGAAFLAAVPVIALLLILAPRLLPEYRADDSGPLDLFSVMLSLAAILPAIYGIKELAKAGLAVAPLLALAAGVLCTLWFVRRQQQLASPLLDMRLFASRTFTAALIVLLVGLVGVSGVMLLVTQYLQLVADLSPLAAGLWMGPPALMMVAAGITAPLIARRIRPGFVVAGALLLSTGGYLLLARLGISPSGTLLPGLFPSDVSQAVAGFSLVYLGLGTIAALGTDLVVGAAPPERAGSASAMSEMVQELGVALGVALLGSLASALYRTKMASMVTGSTGSSISSTQDALSDSLWAATGVANDLPAGALDAAREAFVQGLNTTAAVSGVCILGLAVVAAVSLRHVGTAGKA